MLFFQTRCPSLSASTAVSSLVRAPIVARRDALRAKLGHGHPSLATNGTCLTPDVGPPPQAQNVHIAAIILHDERGVAGRRLLLQAIGWLSLASIQGPTSARYPRRGDEPSALSQLGLL